MTFLRSAVFAIFAIQVLLTGMCRQPEGLRFYLVIGSIQGRRFKTRQDEHTKKRALYSPQRFYTIMRAAEQMERRASPLGWRGEGVRPSILRIYFQPSDARTSHALDVLRPTRRTSLG